MQRSIIDLLACPSCGGDLTFYPVPQIDEVTDGVLQCSHCATKYRIERGIPRFVPAENYASNFGLQWNYFRTTQLDSHTGVPISRERFFRQTGWDATDLDGARVLDVGCGAGRFAEIALDCGATVVALDYSSAIDACRTNHPSPRLHAIQGDMFHLPFKPGQFDFVYCFGVIQSTPDVRAAFLALPKQLRPGGKLTVDSYPKLWLNVLWPKYWLRPLTRRIPPETLFRILQRAVPMLWPISLMLGRVPLVGRKLRHVLPILNYEGVLPLSRAQLREWAVLDTFDMLAPAYDDPQSVESLREWFETAGMERIEVFRSGLVVGRGLRPM